MELHHDETAAAKLLLALADTNNLQSSISSVTNANQQAQTQIHDLINKHYQPTTALPADPLVTLLEWGNTPTDDLLRLSVYADPHHVSTINLDCLHNLTEREYSSVLIHLQRSLHLITPFSVEDVIEHIEYTHWHGEASTEEEYLQLLRYDIFQEQDVRNVSDADLMQMAEENGFITPRALNHLLPTRYRPNYNTEALSTQQLAERHPHLQGLLNTITTADSITVPEGDDVHDFMDESGGYGVPPFGVILAPTNPDFVVEMFEEIIQSSYENGFTDTPTILFTLKTPAPADVNEFIQNVTSTMQRLTAEQTVLGTLKGLQEPCESKATP